MAQKSRIEGVTSKRSLAKSARVVSTRPTAANNQIENERVQNDLDRQPPRPSGPAAEAALEFIFSEIVTNSSNASPTGKKIRELNEDWMKTKNVFSLLAASYEWAAKVKTGGEWDHKRAVLRLQFQHSKVNLFGAEIAHDVWSNIHYGCVGVRLGFPSALLLGASGFHQLVLARRNIPDGVLDRIELNFFTAFDDPRDQNAIGVGIEFKDMENSLAPFRKHIRRNIQRLV